MNTAQEFEEWYAGYPRKIGKLAAHGQGHDVVALAGVAAAHVLKDADVAGVQQRFVGDGQRHRAAV